MRRVHTDAVDDKRFLPLDPELARDELLRRLRINALSRHQESMGQGDELVKILKRAIEQLENTHGRIQAMSTILFAVGLVMVGVAIYEVAFGGQGQEVWGALLGGAGGITTLAATFWTTPLEKMSDSVSDLVKLETVFLGYIRVIGELDSAFQMQYLDTVADKQGALTVDRVMNDTASQVKQMMTHTVQLIDQYVVGQGRSLTELQKQATDLTKRLEALEKSKSQ